MADNLQSGMAQPELIPGMVVVLEALDPTTGDPVADVVISNVVVSGIAVDTDDDGSLLSGPFMLVPGPAPVGNPGDGADVHGGL